MVGGLSIRKAGYADGDKSRLNPWPHFAQDETDAATEVLRSGRVNYWTGEQGRLFEKEFAAYHDVPHVVALCNGTVALEAALQSLEIGPGDEVVVPLRTYVSTAGAMVLRGATLVFADVDVTGSAQVNERCQEGRATSERQCDTASPLAVR